MNTRRDRFRFLLQLVPAGTLLASMGIVTACSVATVPSGQCDSAIDCSSDTEACKQWACEQRRCVEQDSPAGSLPSFTSETAPPCHSVVCDGDGGQTVEVDTSALPPQDGVEPCQKAACDASGNVTTAPDPTNLPPDTAGDCRRPACAADGTATFTPDPTDVPPDTAGDCKTTTCDAGGNVSFAPNPADVPPDTAGDCKVTGCDASGNITLTPDPSDVPTTDAPGDCTKPACDAAGNVTMVPADEPPPAAGCFIYTCQNGQSVQMPADAQLPCSPEGFVCGPSGTCNVCPTADATCTDPGPGAAAHSLATAHGFGTIGYCDDDGFGLCGTLQPGVTSYFGYSASPGAFNLCDFDPYVSVQASASVTLCEYFECPSVTCPSGSTAATMGGLPGCCATGAATEMAITPSCQDSQVYITVETSSAGCTSYSAGFHT